MYTSYKEKEEYRSKYFSLVKQIKSKISSERNFDKRSRLEKEFMFVKRQVDLYGFNFFPSLYLKQHLLRLELLV